MRVLVASLLSTVALMAAFCAPSMAGTNGKFPDQASPPACEVLASNPAVLGNPPEMPAQARNNPSPATGRDGSDNGYFNKVDLFTGACLT